MRATHWLLVGILVGATGFLLARELSTATMRQLAQRMAEAQPTADHPSAESMATLAGVVVGLVLLGICVGMAARQHLFSARAAGITLTVVGAAIGVWAFTRVTSLVGQLHSWGPPFDQFEVITLGGGAVAAILIIVGLIALTSTKSGSTSALAAAAKATSAAPDVSFCPGCGNRLESQDSFCAKCGRPRSGAAV